MRPISQEAQVFTPSTEPDRRLSLRPAAALIAALAAACSSSARGPAGPSASGTLAVEVAGLPTGAAARISVDGPGGYHTDLTAGATIGGLTAGGYAVTPKYVVAQNQTWTPQPGSDSVTVVAGDTAQVLVSYAGAAAPSENYRIAGVQLIQSSQRADGSVPMVGGRDALLRVFAVADSANGDRPAVRVRLFQGATQVDSLDVSAPGGAVPVSVDTASLSASWNVLLPGALVAPGLELQVMVDPADVIPEKNENDNVWPGPAARQPVTVQNVPPFNLRFVPVKQSVNGLTGNVGNGNKDALAAATRGMHPLSQVSVDVHATFTTSAPVLQSNDGNGAWSQILRTTSASCR
jgi:hypothetical protein